MPKISYEHQRFKRTPLHHQIKNAVLCKDLCEYEEIDFLYITIFLIHNLKFCLFLGAKKIVMLKLSW